jgi:hypothetical protein
MEESNKRKGSTKIRREENPKLAMNVVFSQLPKVQ